VTRSETYLVNKKWLGEEPVFTKPVTNVEFIKALSWYNSMCTNDEAREYMDTYLMNLGRNAELKVLKRVSDTWFPNSAAWAARMISKGYQLPETTKQYIDTKLKEVYARATEPPVTTEDRVKVSVQDRMKDKASDLVGEIEALIDSGEKFSLYDWLQKNKVPATYCSTIVAHYAPWLAELLEAYDNTDKQLKEAYSHFSKKQLTERIKFINSIISDAEKYAGVAKKTRAPRKPRPVSIEKKLKAFKYQKESTDYKIASINPEKLIGAQELWTFNTKYKTISVFRALDRAGLQVKGTTLIGYDEKTSMTRGTGRQTETLVKQVLAVGKVALRKVLDAAKTTKPLQMRINENTILLRVVA
jgi:hypothetical protein